MKLYQCSECDKEISDWELSAPAPQGEKAKCPNCGADLEQTMDVE
jgi:DNA-directed RNA polymerase subunit RPC12/RpoP